MTSQATDVISIDDREVRFSNPDKILWPRVGMTKKGLLDYYLQIASVLLPHLRDRAVTFVRAPDGLAGQWWYQTDCPHPPDWVEVTEVKGARGNKMWNYCTIDGAATLAWLVNIGCVELHPLLASGGDIEHASGLAFDLDPGPGCDAIDCCRVALRLRDDLAERGLHAVVKTSGSEGLHVYVALDGTSLFSETRALAREVAQRAAERDPERVTDRMARESRRGKVFVDWQQNGPYKSIVAPYSIRLRELPLVSMPLTWDEVDAAVGERDPRTLLFLPQDALARAAAGDSFATDVRSLRP